MEQTITVMGAGVAACAFAALYAQSGSKVTLISPALCDQLKVGESLPGAALPLLRKLGIQNLEQLLDKTLFSPCHGNISAWGSNKWQLQSAINNPQGGGWHLNRVAFEQALLNYAISFGAKHIRAKITKIARQNHQFQLTIKGAEVQTIYSQNLIDATGRRCLSNHFKLTEHKRKTIQPQLAKVGWQIPTNQQPEHFSRVKSVENGWWYTSAFPATKIGQYQRVICQFGSPQEIKNQAKDSQSWHQEIKQSGLFDSQHLADTQLKPEIQILDASVSAMEQAYQLNLPTQSEQRQSAVVCIGDAALSLDPLSSQGMFFSLYSAVKVAQAFINAKQNPNGLKKYLADYQNSVNQILQHHLKARTLFRCAELRYPDSQYWRLNA